MEYEKHSEMLSDQELDIVKKGFEWISTQQIQSVKELSSTLSAHALWRLPNPYIIRLILKQEKDGSWNSSIRDTARACSALSTEGIVFMESERWLLARKNKNSWNEDIYDTAYAVGALADMGTQERGGCKWLCENYCPAWEQVGTTSLIIMALKKQENLAGSKDFEAFIRGKAQWILSKKGRTEAGNTFPQATWQYRLLFLQALKRRLKIQSTGSLKMSAKAEPGEIKKMI
ncbi:MAG: hypothetical protein NHB15_09115 [Methanosarcina barkeri]|nr:hypothetical protein [Methanosarcina sp. ERenArc_MAG2]